MVEAQLRNLNEIEAAMAQWGREPDYGYLVLPDPATNADRRLINELAARLRARIGPPGEQCCCSIRSRGRRRGDVLY